MYNKEKNCVFALYCTNTPDNRVPPILKGVFRTLTEAKEALTKVHDYGRPLGTGTIYAVPFGLDVEMEKVLEVA